MRRLEITDDPKALVYRLRQTRTVADELMFAGLVGGVAGLVAYLTLQAKEWTGWIALGIFAGAWLFARSDKKETVITVRVDRSGLRSEDLAADWGRGGFLPEVELEWLEFRNFDRGPGDKIVTPGLYLIGLHGDYCVGPGLEEWEAEDLAKRIVKRVPRIRYRGVRGPFD